MVFKIVQNLSCCFIDVKTYSIRAARGFLVNNFIENLTLKNFERVEFFRVEPHKVFIALFLSFLIID